MPHRELRAVDCFPVITESHAVTHTAHSAKLTTKLYLPVDTVAVTADMSTMDQNSGCIHLISLLSHDSIYY